MVIKYAPLTREHPRRRYTPVDYPWNLAPALKRGADNTGKKTPGEPGHTRDTQAHTRTHGTQTNLTSIHTQRHTRTTTRQPKPETAADSSRLTGGAGTYKTGTGYCMHVGIPTVVPTGIIQKT